ncbi:hypothetical protein SS50377_28574 [Spironucleus salmonicida]|uniref:Uncharacterized protein n=1 Tax=Spironucleus salmonicida TaxID=348837 RepID=V6LAX0_9EUKA|nr:hypothetical protein SS50377_28574 [Spironucleus salmonicida]|eukprot:EST41600.1 Hypothetical protein SS50377_18944 [Spironucleus salmonicida]
MSTEIQPIEDDCNQVIQNNGATVEFTPQSQADEQNIIEAEEQQENQIEEIPNQHINSLVTPIEIITDQLQNQQTSSLERVQNVFEGAEDDIGLNNTKPIAPEQESSDSSQRPNTHRKSIAPIHFNKQQKSNYNFKLTTNQPKNDIIFDFQGEVFEKEQKEESYRPNVIPSGYGYGQKAYNKKKSFLGGLPKPLQKQ